MRILTIGLLVLLSACSSATPTAIQGDLLAAAKNRADRGDLTGAARNYRTLAEAGVVQAQYRLGLAYLSGEGVPYSTEAAVEWLSLAAGAGDIVAMRDMADIYADEDSPVFDPPVAARWYAAAAERGDETARFALAELAIQSASSPADQQLAVDSLREGARNGYVRAQLRLADVYERGKLIAVDPVEASRWYAIAANVLGLQAAAGDTRAQIDLARLHLAGKGVRRDPARAISLLEQANRQGRLSATIALAKLYRNGAQGVPKDVSQAVYWRDQASQRNHASSAYELGKWFMRGDGVQIDPLRSRNYFQQAAHLGEERSYVYLGEILGGKFDDLTDYEQAADWYRRAGDIGDGKAQFKLAELHERGHLQVSDPARALALYEVSARNGYQRGEQRAERLRTGLDSEQRSQADDILTQFLADET